MSLPKTLTGEFVRPFRVAGLLRKRHGYWESVPGTVYVVATESIHRDHESARLEVACTLARRQEELNGSERLAVLL